jgi:hypothetical protein
MKLSNPRRIPVTTPTTGKFGKTPRGALEMMVWVVFEDIYEVYDNY